MTTLVRTWVAALNNIPADQTTIPLQVRNLLYQVKTHMVAAGGVVQSSSDSTPGGTSTGVDLVDHWAAPADVVYGAGAAAHSWIVIRHTASGAGYVEFLINWNAANPYQINFAVSTSPISGGSPSNTVAPTVTVAGNSISKTNFQVVASALAPVKFHTMRSTVGDFMFLISADGTGRFSFLLSGNQLAGVEAGDSHIWMTHHVYDVTGSGVPDVGLVSPDVGVWMHTGAVGGVDTGIFVLEVGGLNFQQTLLNTGSPISGKLPALPALVGFPNRVKGYLVDIALAPSDTGVVIGTVEPASGTTTTMIVGEVWMPNGGTAPSL